MKRNIKLFTLLFTLVFLFSLTSISSAKKDEIIQLAILLDTSSSMDGLIDQAKSQLWKIVNDLSRARKRGKSPRIEVALYEYGKSTLPSGEGYIRMITPLSTDLDRVSEELFQLRTNGGDEYCGMVIDAAVKGLQWNRGGGDLKLIFIAGNESFTQGGFNYVSACKNAIGHGIIVNTIHCGGYQEGVNGKWKHGAVLTDGKYMNIDQNQKIRHIQAPQDKEIIRLGKKLNKTYIAYGKKGKANKVRQSKQDKNAGAMCEESLVERSVTKSSEQYRNSGWDLVDAVDEKNLDMDKLSDDELPDKMKKMTKKERKEYVTKMHKQRTVLKKKIARLSIERQTYVEKERKKMTEENSLDIAIIKAVRKQAVKKNFRFN